MPTGAEIQQNFTGVWHMMMGRSEGLQFFDLSVDGFWNSFYAVLVALPVLMLGWVATANAIPEATTFGLRLSLMLRLLVADIGVWLLPIALLAVIARPIGIARRFVHYVVATNWASAFFAWAMLPSMLLRLFAPGADLTELVSFLLFLATLVLSWRVTVVAIGEGMALGTAVFFGVLAASIAALVALQSLLGLGF